MRYILGNLLQRFFIQSVLVDYSASAGKITQNFGKYNYLRHFLTYFCERWSTVLSFMMSFRCPHHAEFAEEVGTQMLLSFAGCRLRKAKCKSRDVGGKNLR